LRRTRVSAKSPLGAALENPRTALSAVGDDEQNIVRVPRGSMSATPKIPEDRPDEAVIRYVCGLAKRLAREDHEAETAGRPASQPEPPK
jgi:hypothetical protein